MYKICNTCVMDTSASNIYFDDFGNCNFCNEFIKSSLNYKNKNLKTKLEEFILKIKSDGKKLKYDCLVGISGGVDSAWALKKAVDNGLRPLAVHFDNGWNTNMAQENIFNLLKKLNIDLITYVVDWDEYRDVMHSFFKANVVDIELIYDNALMKINYSIAKKFQIKYILAGTNRSTEGMHMPKNWNWFKYDQKNIYSIQKKFGKIKIKTLPTIGTLQYIYYSIFHGIKWINFLDYFEYNKNDAMNHLHKFCKFHKYKTKHSESLFTRFYQCYILPEKFQVDKRRVHLSNLIVTKQINRKNALKMLELKAYESEVDYLNDRQYFLKKMKFTNKEFNDYIKSKPNYHYNYLSEKNFWRKLEFIYKKFFKYL